MSILDDTGETGRTRSEYFILVFTSSEKQSAGFFFKCEHKLLDCVEISGTAVENQSGATFPVGNRGHIILRYSHPKAVPVIMCSGESMWTSRTFAGP